MKNKEIEELLNTFKEYASGGMSGLYPSEDTVKNFVSYIEQLEKELKEEQKDNYKQSQLLIEKQKMIEQLETDYKEANESVTWWQNRYNAIVKQNDDNHKKVVKLETIRDKAIEYVEEKGRLKYNPNELMDILKGDSDE